MCVCVCLCVCSWFSVKDFPEGVSSLVSFCCYVQLLGFLLVFDSHEKMCFYVMDNFRPAGRVSRNVKKFNVAIFSDIVTVTDIKLCMMELLKSLPIHTPQMEAGGV